MGALRLFNAISLFTGAGGFDLGIEQSRYFRVRACFDVEPDCIATLETNKRLGLETGQHQFLRECRIIRKDLLETPADQVIVDSGLTRRDEVDLVFGGPPCQSFSVLGKRKGLQDVRGNLILTFASVVDDIQPRSFIFENVPGFATIEDGRPSQWLCQRFQDLGYGIFAGVLGAAHFGDATVRERFFIIGIRDCASVGSPRPTHTTAGWQTPLPGMETFALQPAKTVRQALESSPLEGADVPNHTVIAHKPESIERFLRLRHGERDEIRRRNRLHPDRPAYTLFVGGRKGKLQARTHIHPFEPREITPRECARLHSFPDYWIFEGRHDSVLQQIANSVPVNLGCALGLHVGQLLVQMAENKARPDVEFSLAR